MADDSLLGRFQNAQAQLVTQASDFSLQTIALMVDEGSIDPSPEYQRRSRWTLAKQSALIESFLLNVPVPPVYLAEEQFGSYTVIDGKQRITAIHDFMSGRLALRSLAELPELNECTIRDLPEAMSNALRVRPYIRAVTLLKQSNPDLKYEVFIRLNRGGERLTEQEVRNVAFRGPLNDLILELSENEFLRRQFNITSASERFRKMEDAEIVLRFLALSEMWPYFSGDLARTMDRFMLIYREDEERLEEFRTRFLWTITECERIWGDSAFRRAENGNWRGRGLLGMYDAEMLAVWNGREFTDQVEPSQAIDKTIELFYDAGFLNAVTVSTNTARKLDLRVSAVTDALFRSR
ncbi:Protein of uncharacterised function DUF262 [Mycobacteroides abscessus]|nr:Protein of uncharacterised function DUF262 [Mycobacteroides abscessus]